MLNLSTHILLSTLAFSVFCIAMLQAILVAVQDYLLHHKHANIAIIRWLPALEVMENVLFKFILLGFVLLTLVMLTSLFSFSNIFGKGLWQKTFLSLFAWLDFAILLLGRWYFGWRGRTAIRWTLLGFLLILIVYCGSQLI